MKNGHAQTTQTAHYVLLIVCVAAVAVAFTVSRPQAVYAHNIEPPPVPPDLEVPAGNKVSRKGHAVGTQNYICLHSGSNFVWTFFGPQATLFNDDDEQIVTHFLSPTRMRAAWTAPPGSTHTTPAPSGHDDRLLFRPLLRRAGCDSLAPAPGPWS
jgi:Protein of unknown function (DUF3455)